MPIRESYCYSEYPDTELQSCIEAVKEKEKDEKSKSEKEIGKFNVNYKKCRTYAISDIDNLLKDKGGEEDLRNKIGSSFDEFKNKLIEFKTDQWALKADKKLVLKRLEAIKKEKKEAETPIANLDAETKGEDKSAKPKSLNKTLEIVAGAGLTVIGALMLTSIFCPLTGCPLGVGEASTQILNSNFMAVLVSGAIVPVIARILKEKFDIEIETKQIASIMKDGISAVSMWQKFANRLRDENGKIPKEYQQDLRNYAFTSIKQNYTTEKYEDLVKNVGGQIFEKAIEEAVGKNKMSSIPLEKEQILAIIKQAIDATPKIINWKNLDEDVKISFIDGHVRKLLQNVGVEGWAYKNLESVFDSEVSQRLLAASIVDLEKLIPNKDERYLIYTRAGLDAALETISSKKESLE